MARGADTAAGTIADAATANPPKAGSAVAAVELAATRPNKSPQLRRTHPTSLMAPPRRGWGFF